MQPSSPHPTIGPKRTRRRSATCGAAVVLVAMLAGGCGSVSLRPRSAECATAMVVSGAGCEPMDRAAGDLDLEAKRFVPAAGQSKLYVVRPSIVGGRYLWDIEVDGRRTGAVAEHTYLMLVVPPGPHEVAVVTSENRHAVVVDAAPETNHFVEVVSRIGFTQSRAEVREMGRAPGEAAVRDARLVVAVPRPAS